MSCKPLLGLNDASIEWDKDVQYKCSMSKQSESELTMEFLELTWRASKIVHSKYLLTRLTNTYNLQI